MGRDIKELIITGQLKRNHRQFSPFYDQSRMEYIPTETSSLMANNQPKDLSWTRPIWSHKLRLSKVFLISPPSNELSGWRWRIYGLVLLKVFTRPLAPSFHPYPPSIKLFTLTHPLTAIPDLLSVLSAAARKFQLSPVDEFHGPNGTSSSLYYFVRK